jgi:hypothetical protein
MKELAQEPVQKQWNTYPKGADHFLGPHIVTTAKRYTE